jgi:hypothetical protein
LHDMAQGVWAKAGAHFDNHLSLLGKGSAS